MRKIIALLTIVLLFTCCEPVSAQNLSIVQAPNGDVQIYKTGILLPIVVCPPQNNTYVDTAQVVGYTYTIIRFYAGTTLLDTLHYAPSRDSIKIGSVVVTANNFANYLNLQYIVNRPAGQYWRRTSAQRTALPSTSLCPQIIQIEDTDSAKVMQRSPAGVWKAPILD